MKNQELFFNPSIVEKLCSNFLWNRSEASFAQFKKDSRLFLLGGIKRVNKVSAISGCTSIYINREFGFVQHRQMQTQSPLESLRSAALAFEHYNSVTTLALQHYNGALTLALQCYNSTKTATVFYLNGSTLVSFLYFQQQFWGKIVDFSGIRTWLIWAEGERADHLTSTTTVAANCWRWCNIRSNYHYSKQTARNNGKILLIYCAVS